MNLSQFKRASERAQHCYVETQCVLYSAVVKWLADSTSDQVARVRSLARSFSRIVVHQSSSSLNHCVVPADKSAIAVPQGKVNEQRLADPPLKFEN